MIEFGQIKPKNQFSSSIMTIIMGSAGVGKTTLAASASKLGFSILVNFENRIGHIDETENLRIYPISKGEFRKDERCTYEEFRTLITDIKLGQFKAEYIIIDTIDSMFDTFLPKMDAVDKRLKYQLAYETIAEYLKIIKDSGCNIILTSHSINDPVLQKVTVALNEKLRNKINNITDNVFYYELRETEERILRLKNSESVLCKLTTNGINLYNDIPSEITNPKWIDIHNLLWKDNIIHREAPVNTFQPVLIDARQQIKDIGSYLKEKGFTSREDRKNFLESQVIKGKINGTKLIKEDVDAIQLLLDNNIALDLLLEAFKK